MYKIFKLFIIIIIFTYLSNVLADSYFLSLNQQCAEWDINYNKSVFFIMKLQKAVRENNKEMLASMIKYPLRINQRDDHWYYINNKVEFVRKYKLIIMPMRKILIDENPRDIICNYQGAAISTGLIWFRVSNRSDDQGNIFIMNLKE